jgi:nitroreductase
VNFLEHARRRYSLRDYAETPVDRTIITRCVEAAGLAPSACNAQPWHFVIADETEALQELAAAAVTPGLPINSFVRHAPVIAALIAERPNITSRIGGYLKQKPFYLMDVGIAAEHFCLQAAEEGLGTCMIGWFDESRVKSILQIPEPKSVALLITAGYPSREGSPSKKRKGLEEILSWERYSAGD